MRRSSTHARSQRPRLLLIALLLALATCFGSPAGAAPALGRSTPAPASYVSRGVAVAISNGSDSFTDLGGWLSNWCVHSGATIGAAEFNGDGKDDLWCHDTSGYTWVAINTGSSFFDMGIWLSGWCSHAGSTFGTGNFTGDSRDELWCHDTSGYTWVAKYIEGSFVTQGIWLSGWCNGVSAKFGAGKFRASPYDSLWCYSDGMIRVARSNGNQFTDTGIWLTGFCVTQSGATFGVGDLDGELDDLWCHDPATGTVSVAFAKYDQDGFFWPPFDWISGICQQSGMTIGIGKFKQINNGADIWCRDYAGTIQVATWTSQGVQLHIVLGYWCPPTATIGVADFLDTNGTNPALNQDLWCHSKT